MNVGERPRAVMQPAISVIIPVNNGARYLAEAVQSVLAQTWPPGEVLVVDDGSTDNSGAIARAFGPPVRLLTQANLGPAAARNLGVVQATGDMLAFLDADDIWMPDKLARQLEALRGAPTCEAAVGGVANFISPELDDTQVRLLAHAATQTGHIHAGTLVIGRESFRRIGDFDPRWRYAEFVEWWGRALGLQLRFVTVPELVLRRRLHGGNLTLREHGGHREYLTLLREQVASRRRLAGSMRESSG